MTEELPRIFAPFITPPAEWKNADNYEFLTFILHSKTDNCLSCGGVMHYGDVYRAFGHKNAPPQDNFRRLVPVNFPLPAHVPVVHFSLPARDVPLCPHCLHSTREGQVTYLVSDEKAWLQALAEERAVQHNLRKSGTERPARPKLSPDDIPG